MATRKVFSFNTKLNEDLGIRTRVSSSKAVEIPQVDVDGNELVGVAKQVFRMYSKGTSLVHKFAYHKDFNSFATVVVNEDSGETTTIKMPPPYKKLDDFEMPIEQLPEAVKASEKKGKVIDVEYVKTDAEGNILEEVQLVGDTYYKLQYNMPLYKEYVNGVGEEYGPKRRSKVNGQWVEVDNDKDENGYYRLVTNKYTYVFPYAIGLFNGHEINDRGDKIAGTEGTYMLVGNRGDDNFYAGYANKSGVKFTIKSILTSVLAHPTFGVVNSSDIENGALPQGYFKVDKGTKVAIYNSKGEVAAKFTGENGQLGYKLSDFKPKISRTKDAEDITETLIQKEAADKQVIEDALGEL